MNIDINTGAAISVLLGNDQKIDARDGERKFHTFCCGIIIVCGVSMMVVAMVILLMSLHPHELVTKIQTH